MFCHFGETVARLCREHRVSRTTLRRQLGLSARELAEIEQAAWLPAETVVERLACVFGMSSDPRGWKRLSSLGQERSSRDCGAWRKTVIRQQSRVPRLRMSPLPWSSRPDSAASTTGIA
jgi:transcriptional regulator with XRE-family HTH domain